MSSISPSDTVKVNMAVVKADDPSAPYLCLVRSLIRKGGGTVYVSCIPPNACPSDPLTQAAYIRAWSGDILGDVRVPLAALSRA